MENVGSQKLKGLDQPTVWTFAASLAGSIPGCTNMGQGFPNWPVADILQKELDKVNTNNQYNRSYGNPNMIKAVADMYTPIFNRKIDPMNEVLIASGAVSVLDSIFRGILDDGDEVILFDPSYDCYRAQIQMCGGIVKSVPLKCQLQTREQLKKQFESGKLEESNDFNVDWELFEKTLSAKTKAVLMCSVHNPTGKVFRQPEFERIATILEKWPRVVMIDDGVYEAQILAVEGQKPMSQVRYAQLGKNWDRTVSVYSCGKQFSCTGVRIGYCIGPANIIRYCRSAFQYVNFTLNGHLQDSCAAALVEANKEGSTYWQDIQDQFKHGRDLLVKQLLESCLDIKFWIPEGGFFILADISGVDVPEKYFKDDKGNQLTKDYAFVSYFATEKKVVAIPSSKFYGANWKMGENMVRFAFCKTDATLEEFGAKIK